jgi:hypothetical protein
MVQAAHKQKWCMIVYTLQDSTIEQIQFVLADDDVEFEDEGGLDSDSKNYEDCKRSKSK